jgi:hypothetical protein
MLFKDVNAVFSRTMSGAIEQTFGFHTMTDDLAATMHAVRRQRVNGTFKTIEDVRFTIYPDLKTFVVFIPTDLTFAQMAGGPE